MNKEILYLHDMITPESQLVVAVRQASVLDDVVMVALFMEEVGATNKGVLVRVLLDEAGNIQGIEEA